MIKRAMNVKDYQKQTFDKGRPIYFLIFLINLILEVIVIAGDEYSIDTQLKFTSLLHIGLVIIGIIFIWRKIMKGFLITSLFLFISDLLVLNLVISGILNTKLETYQVSVLVVNDIVKIGIRSYFQLLCPLVCAAQPFVQFLMYLALVIVTTYRNYDTLDQIYWMYYFAMFGIILIFLFLFDTVMRNSFHQQIISQRKQKNWKKIIDQIPHGIFVVTPTISTQTVQQSDLLVSREDHFYTKSSQLFSTPAPELYQVNQFVVDKIQKSEQNNKSSLKKKSNLKQQTDPDIAQNTSPFSGANKSIRIGCKFPDDDLGNQFEGEIVDFEEHLDQITSGRKMINQTPLNLQNKTRRKSMYANSRIPDNETTKKQQESKGLQQDLINSISFQDKNQSQKKQDQPQLTQILQAPTFPEQTGQINVERKINDSNQNYKMIDFPFYNEYFEGLFHQVDTKQYEEKVIKNIQVTLTNGEKTSLFGVLCDLTQKSRASQNRIRQFSDGNQHEYSVEFANTLAEEQQDRYMFAECFYEGLNMYFDIKISPCAWENTEIGFIVIFNDISQRITNQRLKSLDKYKDDLLANVSHDFKTPLNGMAAQLQLITGLLKQQQHQPNEINEQIMSYLNQVEQNVWMLNHLVNDIQDYAQMGNQALRINAGPFVLSDVIREVYNLMKIQCDTKNLQFNVTSSLDLDSLRMNSDKIRLKQILINLLSNAIKFTYDGHVTLFVNTDDQAKEYTSTGIRIIEFSVEDTGVGISDAVKKNLFQMYQTHDINSMNGRGVGLGLFISKYLVSMLGPYNEISIKTSVGHGSTFKFSIFQDLDKNKSNDQLLAPGNATAILGLHSPSASVHTGLLSGQNQMKGSSMSIFRKDNKLTLQKQENSKPSMSVSYIGSQDSGTPKKLPTSKQTKIYAPIASNRVQKPSSTNLNNNNNNQSLIINNSQDHHHNNTINVDEAKSISKDLINSIIWHKATYINPSKIHSNSSSKNAEGRFVRTKYKSETCVPSTDGEIVNASSFQQKAAKQISPFGLDRSKLLLQPSSVVVKGHSPENQDNRDSHFNQFHRKKSNSIFQSNIKTIQVHLNSNFVVNQHFSHSKQKNRKILLSKTADLLDDDIFNQVASNFSRQRDTSIHQHQKQPNKQEGEQQNVNRLISQFNGREREGEGEGEGEEGEEDYFSDGSIRMETLNEYKEFERNQYYFTSPLNPKSLLKKSIDTQIEQQEHLISNCAVHENSTFKATPVPSQIDEIDVAIKDVSQIKSDSTLIGKSTQGQSTKDTLRPEEKQGTPPTNYHNINHNQNNNNNNIFEQQVKQKPKQIEIPENSILENQIFNQKQYSPVARKSFYQKSIPRLIIEFKEFKEKILPNRKLRLLYAEDQPFSVIVMKNFLLELKDQIDLEIVFNGQLALKKIEEFQTKGSPFDAVFMDANMPVLDGPETIMQLNKLVSKGQVDPLIIVICTAYSDRQMFIELGSNFFLSKPISLESVLEALLFILAQIPSLQMNKPSQLQLSLGGKTISD